MGVHKYTQIIYSTIDCTAPPARWPPAGADDQLNFCHLLTHSSYKETLAEYLRGSDNTKSLKLAKLHLLACNKAIDKQFILAATAD